MENVKYWCVSLYAEKGLVHGFSSEPFFEGYLKTDPYKLLKYSDFISLLTTPDGREFRQIRVDSIHSMLVTPVYEAGESAKKADCDCILAAGVDTQKDKVSVTVAGRQNGREPVFQTALSSTLLSPEWFNTAQDSLKDLLYKSMSQGDISTGKAENLANFVFSAFTAMDNNLNNVADIINMATRLSEKSSDLQRRMKNLYEVIIAGQSCHTCAHDGEIPNSPTAIALDRLNDVQDDLSTIDGMLGDIEAKVSTRTD